MTGFVFVTAPCVCCGRLFSFNPHLVPSVRLETHRAPEAVCRDCVDYANPLREKNGLAPIDVPAGAYDALPESEL